MIEFLQSAWDITEPIVGFLGIIFVLWYWLSTAWAKRKKYLNKGSKKFIIALQVGRPVAEAVKKHFGELDALIEVKSLLGKDTLENDSDYKKIIKEVYKALAQNQNAEIHLVVSGPVGLNFLIGQLVGLSHFDVTIYQYDAISKSYKKLPMPKRSWLNY
ncbi:MAG: SAVED domain-containing protein [Sulfurimonas sp.]|nr:SAVED domain-containing protein [Sulfurimonas sp.]